MKSHFTVFGALYFMLILSSKMKTILLLTTEMKEKKLSAHIL
jgi:hypothetical protein